MSINTYQLATMGQNSGDTLTLATDGVIFVEVIVEKSDTRFGGVFFRDEKKSTKQRKKITLKIIIGDKTYKVTKLVTPSPKLLVQDINVIVENLVGNKDVKVFFKS